MTDDNHIVFQSIPLVRSKMKLPFVLLPVPETYFPYIGQIGVLWGSFENEFDRMLEAMIQQTKAAPPGWKFREFKRRRKMFRDQAVICFGAQQTLVSYIQSILTDCVPLQQHRNLLLHGRIHILMKVSGENIVRAQNYIKRRLVTKQYELNDLEQLFYDLGHLCGRINTLLPPIDQKTPFFSSQDRSALQEFWDRIRPPLPNAKKPVPPRVSVQMIPANRS